MTPFVGPLAVILLMVAAEGFFSGSEIAIVSSRWARLRREAEEGDARARLLVRLWRNPDRLLATTLVGSSLSVIAASVMATSLVLDLIKTGRTEWLRSISGREEILVVTVLSPFTLLFGEIIPKSFSQGLADRLAKRIAYPMALAWLLFYPLTAVLTLFSGAVKRVMGARVEASPFVTREELAMAVRLRDLKTELKGHERRMIRRLFTFRETRAREAMVPLVRVASLEEGESLERALGLYSSFHYTRYPVFRKKTFNIVGILNVVACLGEPNLKKKAGRLMEPAYYVPENKGIVDLLREMEREGIRMAVAVDEYGGAVGIVTLEDILEEIVGELEDEYGMKRGVWRRIDESTVEADAHLGVETVSEKLGVPLPPGDYETLAGLMIRRLGRIPRAGEEVAADGLTIRALEVSRRTVEKVLIIFRKGPGKP